MSYIDALRHRLRILVDRAGYDRELEAEREFHLSLERMHQEASGVGQAAAASQARRRFGNLTSQHEARRRLTPLAFIEQLQRDVRFTLRQLWRAPAFSVGVIGTFALGIGANVVMFDILDRLLLKPPAFLASGDATHRVFLSGGEQSEPLGTMDYRRYREVTDWTSSFDATAATWSSTSVAVGNGLASRELPISAVTSTYWSLFRARPALGRFFSSDEDRTPVGTRVAVLGYDYWKSNFGGRSDVLGQTLQIGDGPYTIIGVVPRGFRGLANGQSPAVFVPVTTMAGHVFGTDDPGGYATRHGGNWLEMIARRKPGVSEKAATADLTQAYARSATEEQTETGQSTALPKLPWRAVTAPILIERGPSRSRTAQIVLWLSGVALIVLLIACANVANLLIARAEQRAHEFAVRTAIGVRRRRLLEQLLTESIVLALLGAAAGLLLSLTLGSVLRTQLLGDAATAAPRTDLRVLLFTFGVALAAGTLAGLYPAWHTTHRDIVSGLKAGPRGGARSGAALRAFLLASQAALSVLLLIGAGEFVRSMRNVQEIPLGFEPDRVVYLNPTERSVALTPVERDALLERIALAARENPGVESAARANSVPFWNSRTPRLFRADRDSLSAEGPFVLQAASPAYFATMGTRLLRGRGIGESDAGKGELIVVVSDSMAAKLWPGRDAIGECVRIDGADEPCRRIVGVAGSIRRNGLMSDRGMQYYIPVTQNAPGGGGVLVRTRGEARQYAELLRQRLQPLVPGDGYLKVLPLRDAIDPLTESWRLGATVFTAFGVLALLLACGGLYSVIAFDVTRRTHELGVRMALGAQKEQIVSHVVRRTLSVALIGIVAGLVATGLASPWVKSLLFNVSPFDPLSCALAVGALLVAMTLAAVIPALRAARIEPAVSLQSP
jgi:putative ABC transport system permease protein